MNTGACERCKFWTVMTKKSEDGKVIGLCHRFPPPSSNMAVMAKDWQPITTPGDWCGEYKERK